MGAHYPLRIVAAAVCLHTLRAVNLIDISLQEALVSGSRLPTGGLQRTGKLSIT